MQFFNVFFFSRNYQVFFFVGGVASPRALGIFFFLVGGGGNFCLYWNLPVTLNVVHTPVCQNIILWSWFAHQYSTTIIMRSLAGVDFPGAGDSFSQLGLSLVSMFKHMHVNLSEVQLRLHRSWCGSNQDEWIISVESCFYYTGLLTAPKSIVTLILTNICIHL